MYFLFVTLGGFFANFFPTVFVYVRSTTVAKERNFQIDAVPYLLACICTFHQYLHLFRAHCCHLAQLKV